MLVPTLFARKEHRSPFIGAPQLLGVESHLRIAAVGARFFDDGILLNVFGCQSLDRGSFGAQEGRESVRFRSRRDSL